MSTKLDTTYICYLANLFCFYKFDETGVPAAQQGDLARQKNKDMFFC